MKKALFLLILIAALYPAISQTSYSIPLADISLNSNKLIRKNRINKESLYYYLYTNKKLRDSIHIDSREYDSIGNVIKTGNVNGYNAFTTIRYEYNEDSSIHRVFTDLPYYKAQTQIKEYTYDSIGNIEMIFTYSKDTTYVVMEKRVYDENHKLSSTFEKAGKYDFHLKSRFYYSEDGLSQKVENYTSKEVLDKSYITERDTAANKTTTYIEDKNGKHLIKIASFDSLGRLIKLTGSGTEDFYKWAWTFKPKTINHSADLKFIYNPDGTLFETDVFVDNDMTQIYRHYYTKNDLIPSPTPPSPSPQ